MLEYVASAHILISKTNIIHIKSTLMRPRGVSYFDVTNRLWGGIQKPRRWCEDFISRLPKKRTLSCQSCVCTRRQETASKAPEIGDVSLNKCPDKSQPHKSDTQRVYMQETPRCVSVLELRYCNSETLSTVWCFQKREKSQWLQQTLANFQACLLLLDVIAAAGVTEV